GWRVDASGRQSIFLVRSEKCVDFWEGGLDFSNLNIKNSDRALAAACYEFAASDGPVGSEPPEHYATFGELADGMDVLRWKAPVYRYRALEFFQGLDERR